MADPLQFNETSPLFEKHVPANVRAIKADITEFANPCRFAEIQIQEEDKQLSKLEEELRKSRENTEENLQFFEQRVKTIGDFLRKKASQEEMRKRAVVTCADLEFEDKKKKEKEEFFTQELKNRKYKLKLEFENKSDNPWHGVFTVSQNFHLLVIHGLEESLLQVQDSRNVISESISEVIDLNHTITRIENAVKDSLRMVEVIERLIEKKKRIALKNKDRSSPTKTAAALRAQKNPSPTKTAAALRAQKNPSPTKTAAALRAQKNPSPTKTASALRAQKATLPTKKAHGLKLQFVASPKGKAFELKPEGAASPKGKLAELKPEGAALPKEKPAELKPEGAASPRGKPAELKPEGAASPKGRMQERRSQR